MSSDASARAAEHEASETRQRLSRESIVAAGLELAERPGTTNIAFRDLGALLGVDPTAIYRHFRNKESLMEALLDELGARTVAAVTAPVEQWQDRLRELSIATLDEYIRHPAIAAEAVVLTTNGPGERDAIELMLDAFARAALPDDEIVRHYALLASHVLSVSAGIARSRGQHGVEAVDTSPWFDGIVVADPRRHPMIAKFGQNIMEIGDRELFLRGVEAVIQSAERTAGAHRG